MLARKIQDNIVSEMLSAGGSFEQYDILLRYAAELDELPEPLKTEESLVEGCQSQVWLHMRWDGDEDGEGFVLQADSDTLMVRGVLLILSRMFNGKCAQEIVDCEIDFIDKTDLAYIFDAKRQTGVAKFVSTIKHFCVCPLASRRFGNF